ncbi:MAG: hypothetical protein U0T78_07890 [Cloacibacterium normanense]
MLNDKYFLNFDIKKVFLKTDVDVDASNVVPGANSVFQSKYRSSFNRIWYCMKFNFYP